MPKTVYLDYAAATPLDSRVLKAMQPYFSRSFYNPSAFYLEARKVKEELNTAREQVAFWLGVKAPEIIFTAGGSEANNLALKGVMDQYPGAKVLVSATEHDSVLIPAANYNHQLVNVNEGGLLDLSDLEKKIDSNTVLLSVAYANSEIGTIQPLKRIAGEIERKRKDRQRAGNNLPLLFHSDACQAGNYLDMHASRLGVDLMSLNGGKLYGPKQSGCLFVRRGVKIIPQIEGGGQEFNLRSGTENVAAAIGFAAALDLAQKSKEQESRRMNDLKLLFISQLKDQLPKSTLNGSVKFRLPNNLNVCFAGQDNESLLIRLDLNGIMASAGSACSASKKPPSHVLTALGLSELDVRSSLRFSLGRETQTDDINYCVAALKSLVGA